MKFATIPVNQYGIDPRTIPAMDYRARRSNVTVGMNVATFRFALRYDDQDVRARGYAPFQHTEASLGVGYYLDANTTGKQVRVNNSHSEYVFVHGDRFQQLKESQEWAGVYVLDMVFTERPACGGAWWGQKRVQGGCAQLLDQLDDAQRLRKWDFDQGGDEPYATRPDLEITVLSLQTDSEKSFGQNLKPAVTAYKQAHDIR